MPITLNTFTFDPALTTFREEVQELAGQQTRLVRINGIVPTPGDFAAAEAYLDAIAASAPADQPVELHLRPDRFLLVRRQKFTRELQRDTAIARFELLLRAENPFEENFAMWGLNWHIDASGAQYPLNASGNIPTAIGLVLQADAELTDPSISDGTRSMTFHGVLAANEILEFDGIARTARRDGNDVTAYVSGEFPIIVPGDNLFTYTDATATPYALVVQINYRERWC